MFKMIKISFVLFLLLGAFSLSAQNAKDSKGRKQGPWQKNYPKSKALEYMGTFKDDKPVGKFTYYYPSTKLKAVINHQEGTNRAEAFFYHETGQILSYGIYRDLKKDSTWLNFGPSGRISFKENYKSDVLHGEKVIYFVPEEASDKTIRTSVKMNYNNGELDGEYLEYFDVGVLKVRGAYLNNKRNGTWEEFQPNGKLLAFSRYKNGVKHGWCTAHDENGKEINKVYFYMGKIKTGKDLALLMKQMKEKGVNPNE
jgi:antitoxin component YwqK of YwqJK toxin-antitoxin module